jgi:hypothetical protein
MKLEEQIMEMLVIIQFKYYHQPIYFPNAEDKQKIILHLCQSLLGYIILCCRRITVFQRPLLPLSSW